MSEEKSLDREEESLDSRYGNESPLRERIVLFMYVSPWVWTGVFISLAYMVCDSFLHALQFCSPLFFPSIIMMMFGVLNMDRLDRFQQYRDAIGSADAVSLPRLSEKTGFNENQVRYDIAWYERKSLFPNGKLKGDALLLTPSACMPSENLLSLPSDDATTAFRRKCAAVLDRIKSFRNDYPTGRIADASERLERAVRGLMDDATRYDEDALRYSQVADYYLPLAEKMLDSYTRLESSDANSAENAKDKVVQCLEAIASGMESLHDQAVDAMSRDVEADYQVLLSSLKQDGLIDDDVLSLSAEMKSVPDSDGLRETNGDSLDFRIPNKNSAIEVPCASTV